MGQDKKKVTKRLQFALIQKIKASVSLLAFFVILASGLKGGASLSSILLRSTLVVIVVVLITRVVIQLLVTYEEMNSGQG